MVFLNPYLPFDTSSTLPPPRSNLLISDILSAPAEFVLYHLVSAAISKQVKIVWVDFRGTGRASWESVTRKLGISLPPSFVHVTPSSLPIAVPLPASSPRLIDINDRPSLKPTYDVLLSQIAVDSLIILDGLAELVHLGFPSIDIANLVRAILPSIRSSGSRLITTLHADHLSSVSSSRTGDGHGDLLERLLRLANGWWRVEGLTTGRSADVHGEISAHPLNPMSPDEEVSAFPRVSKAQPLQYRLETGTVKVFPKGTGRGYL